MGGGGRGEEGGGDLRKSAWRGGIREGADFKLAYERTNLEKSMHNDQWRF